jgi:hypothetical protein
MIRESSKKADEQNKAATIKDHCGGGVPAQGADGGQCRQIAQPGEAKKDKSAGYH